MLASLEAVLEAAIDLLELEILLRLILTIALAAVLGLDREIAGQAAGLRTHILVALGAACFTLVSIYGFQDLGTVRDPARVAAQIVTGVGFLGAGAILRTGTSVRGITTAASIWMAAALGMLAGSGLYALAVGATTLTWVTLDVLKRLERRLLPPERRRRRSTDQQPDPDMPG